MYKILEVKFLVFLCCDVYTSEVYDDRNNGIPASYLFFFTDWPEILSGSVLDIQNTKKGNNVCICQSQFLRLPKSMSKCCSIYLCPFLGWAYFDSNFSDVYWIPLLSCSFYLIFDVISTSKIISRYIFFFMVNRTYKRYFACMKIRSTFRTYIKYHSYLVFMFRSVLFRFSLLYVFIILIQRGHTSQNPRQSFFSLDEF